MRPKSVVEADFAQKEQPLRRNRTRVRERELRKTRANDMLCDEHVVIAASIAESVIRALDTKRRWKALTHMLMGACIMAAFVSAVRLAQLM